MGRFSIRRHKRDLSDSATIVTAEVSMSPSQRSIYGSITSPGPRNRLQKTHHSPPSPDENRDVPNDINKRPQRKLFKRLRQPLHRRTGSSPEATMGVKPPEQKSHSNSLPTSPNRPSGLGGRRYANRNWSDNDIRPPISRFTYASPRGSVGSSADILLTPIRGSTAISDEDFVFIPGREDIIQSQGERIESPGPMIQNLPTASSSEMHPHPIFLEPIVIEPVYTREEELLPSESKPLPPPPELEPLIHPEPVLEPDPENEDPSTPMARSFTSETRTITNAVMEVSPKALQETVLVLSAPEPKGSTSKLLDENPVEPIPPTAQKLSIEPVTPSPLTEISIPPTNPPTVTEPSPTKIQALLGWLIRKGFRDDFRSCMSSWFLKELVIGSMSSLEAIIRDPRFRDYLAILKGARNGFVYGVKIRFPHALLMAILFGRGDWSQRAKTIFKATKQHATNLAKFVTIYKTLLLVQRRANGGKEKSADSFFAGLIGGYLVFGDRTAINEQIVLYVCSRVVASFIPRAFPSAPHNPNADVLTPARSIPPDSKIFSVFAAVSWGAVMWLFKYRPETLQPGMANSMQYLYRDSEAWNSLKTLLWHNK
ncbi:mitochondrial import inner membrane translocase subunit TIM17 [Rhizoctonia solani]|uniref:Mitochondrial import inner membrane translocase subunit TIM17 n=1 Tax=Rhizoctonia solani TaxID=456999 RepID=A0A8H8PCJ1_9AGAM|nr:mitochondrial import inner membrane translocase subunit TIM17 [Rhizoctonia solani]QRW27576.1 mitochondrial import inner membrane translocase subunit TIM17 [Rhizoctonia solani]